MAEQDEQLHAMRHSLAHIMAGAIQAVWPHTKFGVGPVVEDGWYYDVDPGGTITEDDMSKIEAEMKKIIAADLPFEQFDKSIDEAIEWAKNNHQDFKLELLNDLKREGTTAAKDLDATQLGVAGGDSKVESVSFYKSGDFTDLCRGPHVASTGKVGAFKLHKVAGAYWRGDEKKPQLQRVYGWGFASKEELDNHIKQVEEAKSRDHRKLGAELDLFTSSELVGSGLPLWTPRGTVLKDKLNALSQQLRREAGYEAVTIPYLTKTDLYKTSGHWDKFGDELFLVKSQETSDELVLKPMNCPHHTQIYAARPRSYRDLPVKYMETTGMYRDEKSGELHGLSRVRAITIDDSHTFCTEAQIESIAGELIDKANSIYDSLELELKFRLSFRDDSDAYLGDKAQWDKAQGIIEELAKHKQLDYFVAEGEAAFYGPKIDFIALDSLGREWQLATVQVDFVQPQRFGLEYTDEGGSAKTPVMIHSALLGSAERFISVYIEHTAGYFPFWLAPEQVRVLSVNDEVKDYIGQIGSTLSEIVLMKPLKYNELRYSVDERNESLGRKIREAETMKVPIILIVGPKDKEAAEVSVRKNGQESKVKLDDLREYLLSL